MALKVAIILVGLWALFGFLAFLWWKRKENQSERQHEKEMKREDHVDDLVEMAEQDTRERELEQ